MADSAGQVSSKSSEKSKFSNSVTRTTSETLRLSDADKVVSHPSSLSATTTNPRKKTSFQITSVTVVGSRASNDGGDDSADDLDESHTDDISEAIDVSRDIENETPSYSEDTFSKDDVFFNASASLGTAPVIPTSSQYGLAILATPDNCENILHPSDNCGNSVTGADIHMGVTDNVINLGVVSTKPDPEMRDIHTHQARHERFKVVKIESTEPFKRGRWVCMDYLDHSISQPKPTAAKSDVSVGKTTDTVGSKVIDTSEHSPQNYSTTESIVSTAETIATVGTPAAEESQSAGEQVSNILPVSLSQVETTQQIPLPNQQSLPSAYTSVSPGQSLQNSVQMVNTGISPSNSQVPQQAQSLSQVPIQQVPSNTNQHQSLQSQQIQQVLASANVVPVQQQQGSIQSQQPLVQQNMQQMQQQQQQQFQPQQFQSMQSQPMMQQQIPQQQIPQQMQQVHMQNVQQMPLQQVQQGQSLQQPIMQQQPMQQMTQQQPQMHQVSYSQPLPQQTNTQPMMQQMLPQQIQGFQQNQMMSNVQNQGMINVQSQPHMQPQYYSNMQPMQQGMPSQAQMMPPMSTGTTMPQVSIHGSSTHIPLQSFPVTSLPQQIMSMPQTPPIATSVPSYPPQFPSSHIPTPSSQQPAQTVHPVSNMVPPQGYVTVSSTAPNYVQSVVSSVPSTDQVSAATTISEAVNVEQGNPPAALLESLAEVTTSAEEVPQGEESESASGASAVAIDNKIEQAMDLVKSHLMFAVREEVEVLKEKIAELMDRINQLEMENTILRANASPETLAQLSPAQNTSQQQPANPP